MTIGDRIKLKRKELGLTQLELGKKLNVTDRAVSKWEQNEGNPDMSIIAPLANALGVSLDYLIMGKDKEEKVVVKTPKEMLIETDDPKYLEKVNDLTFLDIYNNKLINVFSYLVNNNMIIRYYNTMKVEKEYVSSILYMYLISNQIEKIKFFNVKDIGNINNEYWSEEMLNAFVDEKLVTDQTRIYVLSTHKRKLNDGDTNTENYHRHGKWQNMYPMFLDKFSELKKWKWVKYIFDIADDINMSAIEQYNKATKEYGYNCCFLRSTTPSSNSNNMIFQVLAINKLTLNNLLQDSQYELLEHANKINSLSGNEIIDERTIKLKQMKESPDVSLKDRLIFEFCDEYILDYNHLLESKTVEVDGPSINENEEKYYECLLEQYKSLYEEIIMEKNISYIELAYKCAKERNFKLLFKFSIDNKIAPLREALMFGGIEEILNVAKKTLIYTDEDNNNIGYPKRSKILINHNWVEKQDIKYINGLLKLDDINEIPEDVDLAINFLNQLKEKTFNNWVDSIEKKITHIQVKRNNEIEYNRCKTEITKEYLLDQINKENYDSVIIKLCVKLESILKYKYEYSGDLHTMLDLYLKKLLDQNLSFNDNKKYNEWANYLNKLRMKRNNIVHSENNTIDFTEDDLTKCINIIEEIDK